jgi:hypothetical protein
VYANDGQAASALLQTLCAGCDYDNLGKARRTPYKFVLMGDVWCGLAKVPGLESEEETTMEEEVKKRKEFCAPLLDSIIRVTRGRQMLFTTKGYLGLGPEAAQIRDLICVLFGVRLSFVLRKVGSRYILIGASYVDGIIDGEILEQVNLRELNVEEFDIQ